MSLTKVRFHPQRRWVSAHQRTHLSDPVVGRDIGTKGRPVVPVMVHQHVDNIFEAVWLLGREEAAADLVHGLSQLRQTVIVLLGMVPVGRWVKLAASPVSPSRSLMTGNGHTPGPAAASPVPPSRSLMTSNGHTPGPALPQAPAAGHVGC